MTDDDVLEKIQTIIRDELDDDDIVLAPQTRAVDVEGWDSLSHISIVVGVERDFGVQFRSADIAALKNVGDLVRLVQAAQA